MIAIGQIVRPQGNRGEVVIASSTDFGLERFRPGAQVLVSRHGGVETMTVTSSREHDGRWVVGFAGVTTISEAETLRGLELRIPADQLRPLQADTYYVHDLAGAGSRRSRARQSVRSGCPADTESRCWWLRPGTGKCSFLQRGVLSPRGCGREGHRDRSRPRDCLI
jgi:hypothetical protein